MNTLPPHLTALIERAKARSVANGFAVTTVRDDGGLGTAYYASSAEAAYRRFQAMVRAVYPSEWMVPDHVMNHLRTLRDISLDERASRV